MRQNKIHYGELIPCIVLIILTGIVTSFLVISVLGLTSRDTYTPPILYVKVADTSSGHTLARSVACDHRGRAYVSEGEGKRLQVLDDTGNLVMCTKVK